MRVKGTATEAYTLHDRNEPERMITGPDGKILIFYSRKMAEVFAEEQWDQDRSELDVYVWNLHNLIRFVDCSI